MAATFQYQQARSEYKERLAVRNMCIIELLFCLGLRVGELSALDMADYRPEENTVLIHGKGRKELTKENTSSKFRLLLTWRVGKI